MPLRWDCRGAQRRPVLVLPDLRSVHELGPAGVRFRDFVEAIRLTAIESGVTEHGLFCRNCGAYLWPRHTAKYLKQTLGGNC